MSKSTSKLNECTSDDSLLKGPDKNTTTLENQKLVSNGSSNTNTRGHYFVKFSKGNVVQHNEVKCVQTSNEVVELSKINSLEC